MTLPLHILAAGDDADWTKFLFGAVFFLIWGVSAVMSAMAKRREQQRRERVRQQIASGRPPVSQMPPTPQNRPRPVTRGQPPPMRQMPMPMPPRQPPQIRQPTPRLRQPQPRQPQLRRPPALPRMPTPLPATQMPPAAASAATTAPVAATDITGSATARRVVRTSAANAATIKSWMKPATLHRQFILTEVLQPPVGMRPDHLA